MPWRRSPASPARTAPTEGGNLAARSGRIRELIRVTRREPGLVPMGMPAARRPCAAATSASAEPGKLRRRPGLARNRRRRQTFTLEMQVIKSLPAFVLAALLSGGAAWAATPPASAAAAAAPLKGTVLETKDVDPYTYLRLKTKDGEPGRRQQGAGEGGCRSHHREPGGDEGFREQDAQAQVRPDRLRHAGRRRPGTAAAPAADMAAMHANLAKPARSPTSRSPKATGPDARTVAEIVSGRVALKDKPVVVAARS